MSIVCAKQWKNHMPKTIHLLLLPKFFCHVIITCGSRQNRWIYLKQSKTKPAKKKIVLATFSAVIASTLFFQMKKIIKINVCVPNIPCKILCHLLQSHHTSITIASFPLFWDAKCIHTKWNTNKCLRIYVYEMCRTETRFRSHFEAEHSHTHRALTARCTNVRILLWFRHKERKQRRKRQTQIKIKITKHSNIHGGNFVYKTNHSAHCVLYNVRLCM